MPGVRCQLACQRRDRPAPRAIPGLTSAREGDEGNRPREEGPPGPGGGTSSVPRPPIPPCGWRGSRHGGQDAGGPRGACRKPRPMRTPVAWFPAWASRAGAFAPLAGEGTPAPMESASRVYTQRELSGIRALEVGQLVRNSVARVHVGRAFWHPGAGGGAARRKLRPMCIRGMRLLTRDRPAGGVPPVERQSEFCLCQKPHFVCTHGMGFLAR